MFEKLQELRGCRVRLKVFQGRTLLGEVLGILQYYDSNTYKVTQLNNSDFGVYIDTKGAIEEIIYPHDSATPIIYYFI